VDDDSVASMHYHGESHTSVTFLVIESLDSDSNMLFYYF
jgi:hypothetical protein